MYVNEVRSTSRQELSEPEALKAIVGEVGDMDSRKSHAAGGDGDDDDDDE